MAHHAATLTFRVHGKGIFRVHARHESITTSGDKPVGVEDAVVAAIGRRTAERRVVLCATAHHVEWCVVAHIDIVELRDGQIGKEDPVLAGVPRLIESAVIAVHIVIGKTRIHPDHVIVHVLGAFAKTTPGGTAIITHLVLHVHGVQPLHGERVGDDGRVVHGLRRVWRALFPGDAVVERAEHAAVTRRAFDGGV